ncbi:SusD/RagB family nutrient-binding outer membrane lipoprotein [Chitinophaga defluvii]|uniref:SusD/RagB family nutrient-binding outer membrane lipoprotein n=1 Tax=Chitinophaga defluvii TaxID=3163343 RepID=A0ABV2T3D8_9BACT
MKHRTHYILITCLLLVLPFAACNKFGNMNTNPVQSVQMDPAIQLSFVQLQYSGNLETNERLGAMLTMPMVQHIGGAWSNQYGGMYAKQMEYMSILWQSNYISEIRNIVDAVKRSTGDPKRINLNAICRIMKVFIFSRITDLYGDIPYTEAAAAYTDNTIKPKYDRQEDIYNDFFKELTEAVAQLDPQKETNPQDLFFKGNVTQWKRFGNSLHLRLAMRLIKVNPDKAKAEVKKAFDGGLMASNEDICLLRHENIQATYSDVRGNGLSAALNQGDLISYRISNTFINSLKNTNDPRLEHFVRYYWDNPYKPFERVDITAEVKAQVGYVGVSNGLFIWDEWKEPLTIQSPVLGEQKVLNNLQKAQLANFLITNNAPYMHLTYAEVELLLAEACFRWNLNLGGNHTVHYNNGMKAACQQLALFPGGPVITDQQITKFQADNVLAPGKELSQINTQLWTALLLNGPEAYANWRRTGFPKLEPGYNPTYSAIKTIPRRFEYPLTEKEQNSVNYNEALKSMGGKDDWTNRVWWDKQ